MSSDSEFVLIFRANVSVGELSRVFTQSCVSANVLTRWIAATTPLLNDAQGIVGRAKVHEAEMVEEGAQNTPFLGFAAFVRALAEVCAPAALLYTTWPDRSPDQKNTVRGRVFAPACVAVPLDHARKVMLPSMATFLTAYDHLTLSTCNDMGAAEYGLCVLPGEPLIERRQTFPDGTHVTRMAPMPQSPKDAPAAESAKAVAPAKDASAKAAVAAKDAPARGAVAAKAAKPREIKKLDLPVGGDTIAYDFGAVKSDLHRARMRYVEPTDTKLVRNLWRLYTGCEASMTLLRQADRDPLAAHEFAFAAGRMLEELEESLAEFYGTYAIEE